MFTTHHHHARFLIPWAIGCGALFLLPSAACLALALTRGGEKLTLTDRSWIGLEQFQEALEVNASHVPARGDPWYWSLLGGQPGDQRFYASLYNSLWYTAFAVPLGLVCSLAVALLLNRPLPGMGVARALVYLPHVLGGVATLVIWSWLLNPQFGWINEGLRCVYRWLDPMVRLVGLGSTASWPVPTWLYSPTWSKPALVLIHCWTMGGAMLIFLAALQRVPAALYEAAQLDGASRWQCFRRVTVPQITPVILFNAVVMLVFTMQSFNESYLLETRQQQGAILFGVLNIYRVAFEPPYRLGYACAQALILWAVLALLIIPLLASARRWMFHAGRS